MKPLLKESIRFDQEHAVYPDTNKNLALRTYERTLKEHFPQGLKLWFK